MDFSQYKGGYDWAIVIFFFLFLFPQLVRPGLLDVPTVKGQEFLLSPQVEGMHNGKM